MLKIQNKENEGENVIRVLFVCLGNICRSPLAQGVFDKITAERGWTDFFIIDSAGTSAYHKGQKPQQGSCRVAQTHGIDLEKQRSRPLVFSDADEFDYFVAMDRQNYHSLLHEFGMQQNKVFLARGFVDADYVADTADFAQLDVPDPYGQTDKAFEHVYALLQTSLNEFADFLQKHHPQLPAKS